VSIGRRISDCLALAGALLAFGFGAYLLLVGPESTFVTPDGPTNTLRSPTLAGLIPVGIGVVAVWAVAMRRTSGFWLAAAIATSAALLFLFSISLQLAAIAALLLLAGVARTMTARDVGER
jgi:hypothetical protein